MNIKIKSKRYDNFNYFVSMEHGPGKQKQMFRIQTH